MTDRRLIEVAFPIKEVSLNSVHEKRVRHGHISTLHLWPARRPLAASRAVLLATLLPDPGQNSRDDLIKGMAGTVVESTKASGPREITEGGIFRWGRETDTRVGKGTENSIAGFRRRIRAAYGGVAPRVLDPFSGGGAIPLEAMRLGCKAEASDLNPVAWFVLRCTLHYPHLVAGQKRALPHFAFRDRMFVEGFLKKEVGIRGKVALRNAMAALGHGKSGSSKPLSPQLAQTASDRPVSFSWHFRAWSRRVLERARRQLARHYPMYAEFEPLQTRSSPVTTTGAKKEYRRQTPRLLEPDASGNVSPDRLNADFDSAYLNDPHNPRWVAKPTVAYLWARTVRCVSCRAEVPILATRWLCKRSDKRVLLTMQKGDDGVVFGVKSGVPTADGTAAEKRKYDSQVGGGTISDKVLTCPCCNVTMTTSDLQVEGRAGRFGRQMTAVVVDGQQGKEYRRPTVKELEEAEVDEASLEEAFDGIPFGLPTEATPKIGSLGNGITSYGLDGWRKLFTNRQLLALGTLIREIRRCHKERVCNSLQSPPPPIWEEALTAYLACTLSKLSDYSSALSSWHISGEKLRQTYSRFALTMVWDYCEVNPLSERTGGFAAMAEWVARVVQHLELATEGAPAPQVVLRSAIESATHGPFDVICTDPPYYALIPYSDIMDFFHIWLRRTLHGLSSETDAVFSRHLGPKWDAAANDGELIDDKSRFYDDDETSKRNYEDGMARSFSRFYEALRGDGRLVIVFANKQPDAWETLVSALIRAGFVVTCSWPIQTEMQNRLRSLSSAALSSSIWLVCRKRSGAARPGWDRSVFHEMRVKITQRLREFWDAGIRGPDFVWAATGPALEAFSKHPVVKKTDAPGKLVTIAAFLRQVRRMVVGFVIGQLIDKEDGTADELDDLTTYYLLHRNDYGLELAPAGACILYAISCNLSDTDLAGTLDLLGRGSSGSEFKLKPWNRRRAKTLGEQLADGTVPTLIDCLHKVMQLWKTGDQTRVNAYLDIRGLWRNELFARVVQAVIEQAPLNSEERSVLESVQNHLGNKTNASRSAQLSLGGPIDQS